MPTNDLNLEPINNLNWRKTLQVRTTPAQLEFVADHEPVALVILSKAYVRAGNVDWHPLAIVMDGEVIGVAAVTCDQKRSEIFHLVIDSAQQGKGLGKASVQRLVDYIRTTWPEVDTVGLTVHPKNEVAQHVYKACGFVATGELQHAEPVMEIQL